MSRKIEFAHMDDLIRRYQSGESIKQLADALGVDRLTVRRRLKEHGVRIRGRSEAERVKWSRMRHDRAAIERQLAKAWAARRGRVDSLEVKIKRAKTVAAKLLRRSPDEDRLATLLRQRGLAVTQQHPVGPYNVDLAIREAGVAVEVQGANHRRPWSSIRRQRIEYILDAGWALLVVYVPMHRKPDLPRIADQVVTFTDLVRRTPSLIGQYGVIGRDGQPMTPRRFDLPRRPRVPGF